METPATAGAEALALFDRLLGHFVDPETVTVERRAGAVVVTPKGEGTFAVTLYDQGDEAMVAAERWHAHYDEADQAAFLALWLLTPYYRVVHELRGGVLAAVWIERWEAAGWEGMEPVFFLNPEYAPDWDPAEGHSFHRRTFQQAVAAPPRPWSELVPGAVLDGSQLPVGSRLGVETFAVERPLGPTIDLE